MLTLVNFLAAFVASWVAVYAIYGLTLVGVHCVRWTVRGASWLIGYAGPGVRLVLVRPVWRVVRTVARLGEGVHIQSSHVDSIVAPVVTSAYTIAQRRALIAEVGPAAAGTTGQVGAALPG